MYDIGPNLLVTCPTVSNIMVIRLCAKFFQDTYLLFNVVKAGHTHDFISFGKLTACSIQILLTAPFSFCLYFCLI